MTRGSRKSAAGLTLHVLANGQDSARLGLAVRAKGAVQRNRIKRRLRAAAGQADLGAYDVVVRADARALGVDFQELVNTFDAIAGERR